MIIDLQRRIAEIGRIRIGQQVPAGKGTRPTKLDTFRLTSPDRQRITQAAHLYGGQPCEWQAPAGKQWEIVTDTDTLPVIVPPGDIAFTQHFELWSAGGCQRRCDGANEQISGGSCLCDPDPATRECQIHTRLSVLLRDMAGLGVWRLDTQGYYAATELSGAVEVIRMAAGQGRMLPATLRLDQRMVKRAGQTRRFPVPVLDIDITPAQLLSGDAGVTEIAEAPRNGIPTVEQILASDDPEIALLEASHQLAEQHEQRQRALTPVPDTVPEWPTTSIAEQAAAKPTRRKSTQAPIPATGIKPRTVAQATKTVDEKEPIRPPEQERAEMAAYVDATQPGLIDDLGISRDDVRMINEQQMKLLQIRFKEQGFNDRQTRIDYTVGLIGHAIDSSKDLTQHEASVVIDSLES